MLLPLPRARGGDVSAPEGARAPEIEIRKIVRKQDDGYAAGITFHHWEIPTYANGRSEYAVGSDKSFLDGVPSLTVALDQYKYGDELLVNVYTGAEPRVVERNPSPWNRLQVYLGPADDVRVAEMLEDVARLIRQRASERGSA